ncbi:MAG: hypothetical protein H6Q73_1826 [Firmicutes bacterium]|nr:hypothetical protein [Bacillota bacterium]
MADDEEELVAEETDEELSEEESEVDEDNSDDSSDSSSESSTGITPAKMAKNALRKANKQENTGSITLVGDPRLVGGVTATLKNFGSFDSKYIISKAVHRISGGYTTDIEIRKCLDGY